MRKFVFPLLLALTILLSACAPAPAAPAVDGPTAVPTSATAFPTQLPTEAPVWPVSLTDSLGRNVTLDAVPQRIISLAPSFTEILFALDAGSNVVGVTSYCDYPDQARLITEIGGYSADTISVETIVSLKPDLVLADGDSQKSVVEALEQANVKVVSFSSNSFEDVFATISQVGRLTGHDGKAASVISDMQKRISAVEAKVAALPLDQRPTVFWEVWDEPLMTAGPNTFAGQLIQMAGGVSIFTDVSEDYPQVSTEEVIKRNPAVIMGPDSHGDKLTTEQLTTRTGWSVIDAVKNGKVFLVNGNTSSRPGPRLVDALEEMAKDLHPDLFE